MVYFNGYMVDDVVLENIISLQNCQYPNNKYKYRDIAFESIINPSGKSKMVQRLYNDILAKNKIDYGKIPNSKGDITKYEGYPSMIKSIETLNALFEGKKDENLQDLNTMNKLHDLIITNRADFEFGFKFEIEFISMIYNTLVMTLYELINMCIVSYVNYLKDVHQVEYKFAPAKKTSNTWMVQSAANDFIKSYEKGEWTKLMSYFKKNSSNLIGGLIALGAPTAVTVTVGVILGITAILFTIRTLIYFYFASSLKISDYVRTQASFLKASIDNSNGDNTVAINKQADMLSKLEGISIFIETKILKTEKEAKKEIMLSNKENFSPKELADTIELL